MIKTADSNSKSCEEGGKNERHLLVRDTRGHPQCCLQRQRCCHGQDGYKWFRRTGAGLIYIQRESFKLNRQDFLTIYVHHSEMAGRSPCQMVSSPASKVFKLRMELREGLQG